MTCVGPQLFGMIDERYFGEMKSGFMGDVVKLIAFVIILFQNLITIIRLFCFTNAEFRLNAQLLIPSMLIPHHTLSTHQVTN